ncbi:MAG: hypothetical protein PHT59_03210 [Candidatus Omnitrophica bacterium]|nr:hypothetical protein [Candidatus Omnitrophota bacterium]
MNSGNLSAIFSSSIRMANSFSSFASSVSRSSPAYANYSTELSWYQAGNYDYQGANPASFTNFASGNRDFSGVTRYGEQGAVITPTGINAVTAKEGELLATQVKYVDGTQISETRNFYSDGQGGFIETDPGHNNMVVGSGHGWNTDVMQNTVNGQYDPGHMVINSPNGDARDIDLSDGSYTIRNGNQQVGSGSVGALDVGYDQATQSFDVTSRNLQVYAADLEAGRGALTQEAAALLSMIPGDPSEWTYTGSEGNTDLYQNVYTGETIQLVNKGEVKAGQYQWVDSQGNIFGQSNTAVPATAEQLQALNDKLDPAYGKYETIGDPYKDILGIANPKEFETLDLASLEGWLKTMASVSGSGVTATVSSSGSTFTLWKEGTDEAGNKDLTGKFVYSFQYDNEERPEAGKMTFSDFAAGQTAEAAIDLAGKYKEIVQGWGATSTGINP